MLIGGADYSYEGPYDLKVIIAEILAVWPQAVKHSLNDPGPGKGKDTYDFSTPGEFMVCRDQSTYDLIEKEGYLEELDAGMITVWPEDDGVAFVCTPQPSETYDLVQRILARLNGVPST